VDEDVKSKKVGILGVLIFNYVIIHLGKKRRRGVMVHITSSHSVITQSRISFLVAV
jgi:hypothetical protein